MQHQTTEKLIEKLKQYPADTPIAVSIWYVDDIEQQDSDLTYPQILEVLAILEDSHDATIGINWDVINCVIKLVKNGD